MHLGPIGAFVLPLLVPFIFAPQFFASVVHWLLQGHLLGPQVARRPRWHLDLQLAEEEGFDLRLER